MNNNHEIDITKLISELEKNEAMSPEKIKEIQNYKIQLKKILDDEDKSNKTINTVVTSSLGTAVAAAIAPSILTGIGVGVATTVAAIAATSLVGVAGIASISGIIAKLLFDGKSKKEKMELYDQVNEIIKLDR